MEKKKRCEYGERCYRKNPEHLREYHHEPEQPKKDPTKFTPKRKLNGEPSTRTFKQTKLDTFRRRRTPSPQHAKRKPESPKKKPLPTSSVRKEKASPSKKEIIEESPEEDSDDEEMGDVTSNSWVFKGNSVSDSSPSPPPSPGALSVDPEWNSYSSAQKIKKLFLVSMPDDFYSFYEFCETQNGKLPKEALSIFGLKLVGPFDILTGEVAAENLSAKKALCHWRFFMDPPEFQTILVADKGLHYGYWRDDSKDDDPFVVSNTVPSCSILSVAANIFGAVAIHLEGYVRRCTPFQKVQANQILKSLKQWAGDREFPLSDMKESMRQRKKKVVAPTFHSLGIVVPFDPKTQVGYRPISETNENLKKLLNGVIKAKTPASAESKMEQLDRLVNFANIANDEGDFGHGLELGTDLFCMGSEQFHNHARHLLTTAYYLLKRPEWGEIITAHLKNRRTGLELSALRH